MCYCPTPTLHLNLALTGDGAFLFSLKKSHSVWFISVLNYGDTENVLINHLLHVIPMSYPCHYTNLCPHKPHKHAPPPPTYLIVLMLWLESIQYLMYCKWTKILLIPLHVKTIIKNTWPECTLNLITLKTSFSKILVQQKHWRKNKTGSLLGWTLTGN